MSLVKSRSHSLSSGCLDESDFNTILSLFDEIGKKSLPQLDLIKITSGLKRFRCIDQSRYEAMLLKYASFRGSYTDKVFMFLKDILHCVNLVDLALVLSDSGYPDLCDSLLLMRNSLVNIVQNRQLPYAIEVHEFYVTLKRCADDNVFLSGSKAHFEGMITEMVKKLQSCSNPGRKQLISDKLVALFFLLAKQYSNIKDRCNTFERLRKIFPHDVDRTTFDGVFHSHMALNWAIQGDVSAAERHERLAKLSCENLSPCFATAAMRLNTQCKNNRIFYDSHDNDFLRRAFSDFEMGLHSSVDFGDDERSVWNTVSTLEMCHSLLGINLYLDVCDIESIDTRNIERARVLLSRFHEPQDCRRKMFYKLAMGRLHEKDDLKVAEAYVFESFVLTSEGCYKDVEKVNIRNYLQLLKSKQLPTPSL